MRKFEQSVIPFFILSPILIMGKAIVGLVDETIPDYYNILGLNESSSQEEVLKAFYILSEKYHPDRNNQPDAQVIFQTIREAYEVLSDVNKRREYDYRRKLTGIYQPTMNFGYPGGANSNPFGGSYYNGQQFGGGTGYGWSSGNAGGGYGWGGIGGGGNEWRGSGGGGYGGSTRNAGADSYQWRSGGAGYGWGSGGAGSGGYGWGAGGGASDGTAWTTGGSGVGGNGNAGWSTAGGGSSNDDSYQYYTSQTKNGCTTYTMKRGDFVTTHTTCE